jgi:hypothetical protein
VDRGVVDAQQPGGGAAQVAAQPRLGAQRADQLVAAARGPGVRAVDQLLEVRDRVGPDLPVALGLLGVVADHEPKLPSRSRGTSISTGPTSVNTVLETSVLDRWPPR